jgi:hypothetical protein
MRCEVEGLEARLELQERGAAGMGMGMGIGGVDLEDGADDLSSVLMLEMETLKAEHAHEIGCKDDEINALKRKIASGGSEASLAVSGEVRRDASAQLADARKEAQDLSTSTELLRAELGRVGYALTKSEGDTER